MPSGSKHQGATLVKGLLLGDPGSGKTGALTSLIAAGYKLRVYDFDNLLGTLVSFIMHECPDKIDNLAYQTFTDKLKGTDMPIMMMGNAMKVMPNNDGTPKAYVNALHQLDHWKDPDGDDLGNPGSWGPDTVVVLDSLTSVSEAAFRYCQAINPGGREPQALYHAAQQLIMNLLSMLVAKEWNVNVLVLCHLAYTRKPRSQEAKNDMTVHETLELGKGYPRSVGSALNEIIASKFNTCLLMEDKGNDVRVIHTKSTMLVDLKNPVPFAGHDQLPIKDGLATFFRAVNSTVLQPEN